MKITVSKKKNLKGRVGRPPTAGVGKRSSFNTRLRTDLKERLASEGARSGRSLSEEIEFRLEMSFKRDDILGGPHLRSLSTTFCGILALIESSSKKSWRDDRLTFDAAKAAIEAVFDALAPENDNVLDERQQMKIADYVRELLLRDEMSGLSQSVAGLMGAVSDLKNEKA